MQRNARDEKIRYNDTDRIQRTVVYNNNDKRVGKHVFVMFILHILNRLLSFINKIFIENVGCWLIYLGCPRHFFNDL